MRVDVAELDVLLGLAPPSARGTGATNGPADTSGSMDDMIRREFLRALAVTGALAAFSGEDTEAPADGAPGRSSAEFGAMNAHLWQVYQLARSKGSVYPVVRDQLAMLTESLDARTNATASLCSAAGDLFQLAGELAFDANRYTDAAASYTLAASASKEAGDYDLWACALVRHSFIDTSNDTPQRGAPWRLRLEFPKEGTVR